jgi:hypothetical protein
MERVHAPYPMPLAPGPSGTGRASMPSGRQFLGIFMAGLVAMGAVMLAFWSVSVIIP